MFSENLLVFCLLIEMCEKKIAVEFESKRGASVFEVWGELEMFLHLQKGAGSCRQRSLGTSKLNNLLTEI